MQVAGSQEQKAKDDSKKYYDRGAKLISYQVGDQVLILRPSVANKLKGFWKGPYTIVQKLSSTTYRVQKDRQSTKRYTYHINFLQRWNSPSAVCMMYTAVSEEQHPIPCWKTEGQLQQLTINDQLDQNQQEQLSQVVDKYQKLFSVETGTTATTSITIDTGEATPSSSPPYRIPQARLASAKQEVKEMLVAGVIVPSKSPWAAPMLLVPKKDGSVRPVIDFRKLNKVTVPDPFPMPRIEELIDQLATAKFITTLDLTKGYWQVPVHPASQEKTAFVTPFGKYHFTKMPFGLMGAPSTFQRLMNNLFGDANDHVSAYLDDIVIYSKTWEEHLTHLEEVLGKLEKEGLTLKAKKCQMGMKECLYLGHTVGNGKVLPEKAKVQAIQEFLTPKLKKHVRSFLGLAGYYRRFVAHFSTIAAPLSDLTKNDRPNKVKWEGGEEEAFNQLKQSLVSQPVLQGPQYDRPFFLQTDASDVGIGAVLSQKDEEGHDRPVAYYSRKLMPRECNFAAMDKECLAIVDGIKHFAVYLTGVPFTVVTDHQCLQYLDSVRDNGGRRTRWTVLLQEYNFVVQHRAGPLNGNADGLSRQAWMLQPEGVEGSVRSCRDELQTTTVDPLGAGIHRLQDDCKMNT